MHSSFLVRPLQHCLYPPRILPSVGQQPAATHCSPLRVPHRCPALCLSVSEPLSVRLPLSLLASFMFSNCSIAADAGAALTRRKRRVLSDLDVREGRVEVRGHAPSVIASETSPVASWEFSPIPSFLFPKDASLS